MIKDISIGIGETYSISGLDIKRISKLKYNLDGDRKIYSKKEVLHMINRKTDNTKYRIKSLYREINDLEFDILDLNDQLNVNNLEIEELKAENESLKAEMESIRETEVDDTMEDEVYSLECEIKDLREELDEFKTAPIEVIARKRKVWQAIDIVVSKHKDLWINYCRECGVPYFDHSTREILFDKLSMYDIAGIKEVNDKSIFNSVKYFWKDVPEEIKEYIVNDLWNRLIDPENEEDLFSISARFSKGIMLYDSIKIEIEQLVKLICNIMRLELDDKAISFRECGDHALYVSCSELLGSIPEFKTVCELESMIQKIFMFGISSNINCLRETDRLICQINSELKAILRKFPNKEEGLKKLRVYLDNELKKHYIYILEFTAKEARRGNNRYNQSENKETALESEVYKIIKNNNYSYKEFVKVYHPDLHMSKGPEVVNKYKEYIQIANNNRAIWWKAA